MKGLKFLLNNFLEKDGPIFTFGDGSEGTVKGLGIIKCKTIDLKGVFYVKCLQNYLISIRRLFDAAYKVIFDND